MNSKKIQYKRRQLKVAMYLLERIFGREAAQVILKFIKEQFSLGFEFEIKKHPETERRHIEIQPQLQPVREQQGGWIPWSDAVPTPAPAPVAPSDWTTTSSATTWTDTDSSTTDWTAPPGSTTSWRIDRD